MNAKVFFIKALIFTALLCSNAIARVNITAQSLIDSTVQATCDNKYDDNQKILECIASKYSPSKTIKLDYSNIKIYEVDFSGFGTGWVLTPKAEDKNLLIEIEGTYLYASDIFNLESCCNSESPILILEIFQTKNNFLNSCDVCPTTSNLLAYNLNNLSQPPVTIDLNHNYTNQTIFGPLVSHDLTYDSASLAWEENRSAFTVNARFMGPPQQRIPINIELRFNGQTWLTNVSKQ